MTRVQSAHPAVQRAGNGSSEDVVLSQIGYGANSICQETQRAAESPAYTFYFLSSGGCLEG